MERRGPGLAALLVAAAAGVAVGLLLAPRAGRQTRESVSGWLRRRFSPRGGIVLVNGRTSRKHRRGS